MTVARYHSLVSCPKALPASLRVTATCGDLIMAVAHNTLPIFGVQFHPESILTPLGNRLIENFFHQTH
jgi:anthranilate synthase component 2